MIKFRKGYLAIGLHILSTIFIKLAWYGHLKFKRNDNCF